MCFGGYSVLGRCDTCAPTGLGTCVRGLWDALDPRVQTKAKDQLEEFWATLSSRLSAYEAAPPATRNPFQKEGLLVMLGESRLGGVPC